MLCPCQAVHFASGSLEDIFDDKLIITISLTEQHGQCKDDNTGKVNFQNLIEKYSDFNWTFGLI